MENNAIINTRLEELFNVMDPRAYVNIFTKTKNGKDAILRSTNIYKLIADDEFIGKYGSYEVIGLTIILNHTNLLIKEA